MKKSFVLLLFLGMFVNSNSQNITLKGFVTNNSQRISNATVTLNDENLKTITDSLGYFTLSNISKGTYHLKISAIGFEIEERIIKLQNNISLNIDLKKSHQQLNDVVISGTLKSVNRLESPVPVEVYSPSYFKKNPTPNIFEALQNVNGVRPQLNCNICNTGDIHINGLEGPYTMVLIDGMPILSSLSTVYGLSGIPNSLIERVEIVKGPASSLYGSEAVGGLINIITKKPTNAPKFSLDMMNTSWNELNTDIGITYQLNKNISVLNGINIFKFNNIVDNNNDNFTDVTLQNRVSVFQKINIQRRYNKLFSFALRYFNEDRWGGETTWNKSFRGSDSIYGESIYTNRYELIGNYQLPTKEKLFLSFSYTNHQQDSRYGTTIFDADQRILFSQLTWDKSFQQHDILAGVAFRRTFYDDNTIATFDVINKINSPNISTIPGIFIQDEISIAEKHKLLLGVRVDHNSLHGNIITPRLAYKWKINENNILRFNAGTGFRVVNLFTEEHAALTGARVIEIKNELKPEKSYNINLNYIKKIFSQNGTIINLDFSSWLTYFNNRIVGDYETDPNKIIFDNLQGHAISKGLTANIDASFSNGLKIITGVTLMNVTTTNNNITQQQILTEKFSGTWSVSYKIKKLHVDIDYTGNIYGPMRLPLLSDLDPRQPYSPTWSIQNIQFTFFGFKKVEFYGGIKNLLNWTPNENNPFIIARSHDPFDKNVVYGSDGKVVATAENPYALTFDPSYVYAPNQGIRGFLGIRYTIK
jgi:outer membrane receptor for ferrienterochelin and colicins